MKTVSATEMKNRFGRYLETAVAEPVVVEKSGRPVAVLLSHDEFQRLEHFEDAYWVARAEAATAEGLATPEDAERLLKRFHELERDAET